MKEEKLDSITDLLHEANFLGCHEVMEVYTHLIVEGLHFKNVLVWESFAFHRQIIPLHKDVSKYLMYHFKSVWQKDEWLHIEFEDLLRHVTCDD